jgi:glutamine amidotransferase-like uncharacterized protein
MTTIVLPAGEGTWKAAYRAANLLSRDGRKPAWATQPFKGRTCAGEEIAFDAGTMVLESLQSGEVPSVAELKSRLGVDAIELAGAEDWGGSAIGSIRIAVYGGGGAPYNHAAAYSELGFLVDFIFPDDILKGALANFDLLAVPGGGNRAMKGQLDPLGEAGCRAIAEFVREGGMYLGCCAGAFDASLVGPEFLQVCPQQRHMQMINAAVWNSGDEWLGLNSPGVGVVRAKVAVHHPVTFGLSGELAITHYNGPLYRLQQNTVESASDAAGLLTVVGTERDFTPSERFLGADPKPDPSLISRAIDFGAFNAVAGGYGKGRVVLFGSHPEMGLGLNMDDWSSPARLLANAAFWQATSRKGRAIATPARDDRAAAVSALHGLATALDRLDRVVTAAEALLRRDSSAAPWLQERLAMSTFGMSGQEIWRRNLAGFQPSKEMMRTTIAEIEARIAMAAPQPGETLTARSRAIGQALEELDLAINYRTPAGWDIDVGYEGLLQHLERAEAMLLKADANFDKSFPPDPNPYAYLGESPFHLTVGSYLSAAGVFANCKLLLRLQNAKLANAIALVEARPLAA